MKYYMAPMEGITGFAYRSAHAACYGPMDKYFTPFVVPTVERSLKTRERKEINPENNKGIPVVPQILTNRAELFVDLAKELEQMGYTEGNLNLGCPSGTVTTKGRGAGFLGRPLELEHFLEEIFDGCPIRISVKSRIGVEDVGEFERILMMYNQYPMTELILHPRLLKEKYQGLPHMDIFRMAVNLCSNPLIYNGNIFTVEDLVKLKEDYPAERYPWLEGVMLGRGLIANPGLFLECQGQESTAGMAKKFHDAFYYRKKEEIQDPKSLLYHMKEFWFYMIHSFEDSQKDAKKLRKITKCSEYEAWTEQMFRYGTWNTKNGFKPPIK